jgi:hypothetical protein
MKNNRKAAKAISMKMASKSAGGVIMASAIMAKMAKAVINIEK